MMENIDMIKRFLFYGLSGWCIEVAFTGAASLLSGDLRLLAHTNLWMFFIYGCAVFLEPLHDIIRNWNWFFRGVIWTVIIWGMEYSSGLLLVKLLGIYAWYYGGQLSVDGLVNLSFAPAWFLAGFIFERLHRTLDYMTVFGRIK
jgi:hypothetical protein